MHEIGVVVEDQQKKATISSRIRQAQMKVKGENHMGLPEKQTNEI
jgi:hypothetical protein